MEQKGRFITLEGCEGVGKSKQTKLLKEYLLSVGVNALFTREPGGTEAGERIREILLGKHSGEMSALTELLLYNAARAQHIEEVILPALNSGMVVVCDRFYDSSFAYQGFGGGLEPKLVKSVNAAACGGIVPHLTLFLNLPPAQAFARKGGADSTDRLESKGIEFHQRVYEGFLSIDEPRFVRIDASGSVEQTHTLIVQRVQELLGI